MENALGIGAVIAIIIMMIVNLYLYHKIFRVTYFNLGKGIIMELIFAWLAAMIEVALFGKIITSLFTGIFKLLGVVIKVALIILAIAAVLFIVWKIVQVIKGKSNGTPDETKANSDNYLQTNTYNATGEKVEGYEKNEKAPTEQETEIMANINNGIRMNICTNCGTALADDAIFCSKCGFHIKVEETVVKYVFCSECGTRLPSDALFCDNCGTAQNN